MPFLDTTRTSTLYADFSTNYQFRSYNPTFPTPFDQTWNSYKTNWQFSGHLGFSANCTWIEVKTQPGGPGTAWNVWMYLRILSNNGAGTSNTTDILIFSSLGISGATTYIDYGGSISGNHSASVGTDVLWDVSETADPSVFDYATFPRYTTYNWYEKATVGSTAVITTTVTGKGSATATGTVSTTRATAAYNAILGATGSCLGNATHSFGLTNIKVNNVVVQDIPHSHTWHSQSATEWSYSLLGGYDAFGIATGANGSISTTSYLTRKCNVSGRFRSWLSHYDDAQSIDILGFNKTTTGYLRTAMNTSNGEYSGTQVMARYSASTTLTEEAYGSDTKTTTLDEVPTYISAELALATLTGGDLFTGADARWVRFRGWRFPGASISQANTYSISGTGDDRNYSPYPNFSGYRYLDIQVKSLSGSQTATIEITEQPGGLIKTWSLTTSSSTFETKTIDLCSPTNITSTTDNQDDPYPRLNISDTTFQSQEQRNLKYYGVSRISRLRVVSNTNFNIGTTTLKKDTTNLFNIIPSGYWHRDKRITDSLVAPVSGTQTLYYCRRFFQQNTDGRDEEESDIHWQYTTGGVSGVAFATLLPQTITNICSSITATDTYPTGGAVIRHPGWSATNTTAYPGSGTCSVSQPPLTNCYLNGDTGYATWLFGGGVLITPDATQANGSSYSYGFNFTGGSITAQTIFNRINGDFIPDIPDPFNVVAVTSPAVKEGLYLRSGTIIRGANHGLLLNSDGTPNTSATNPVNLILNSDSSNRGSATPNALGMFETTTPYAKGDRDHNSNYVSLTVGLLPVHWSKKHRSVFKYTATTGQRLTSACHAAGNQVYGAVKIGKAHLYFSYDATPTNWVEVNTGITADDLTVRWNPYAMTKTLVVVIGNGTNITYQRTSDDGVNFYMATTLSTTGTRPTMLITQSGGEFIFWRSTGGNITRLYRDLQGNTLIAASDVVTGGVVADDDITCYQYPYSQKLVLLYRNTSGNIITVVSSDNGQTFS
jgi:hypothetical protein